MYFRTFRMEQMEINIWGFVGVALDQNRLVDARGSRPPLGHIPVLGVKISYAVRSFFAGTKRISIRLSSASAMRFNKERECPS